MARPADGQRFVLAAGLSNDRRYVGVLSSLYPTPGTQYGWLLDVPATAEVIVPVAPEPLAL